MATKKDIVDRFYKSLESEEFELDNLDQARLVFNEKHEVVVENEHGTQYDINELSEVEKNISFDILNF